MENDYPNIANNNDVETAHAAGERDELAIQRESPCTLTPERTRGSPAFCTNERRTNRVMLAIMALSSRNYDSIARGSRYKHEHYEYSVLLTVYSVHTNFRGISFTAIRTRFSTALSTIMFAIYLPTAVALEHTESANSTCVVRLTTHDPYLLARLFPTLTVH